MLQKRFSASGQCRLTVVAGLLVAGLGSGIAMTTVYAQDRTKNETARRELDSLLDTLGEVLKPTSPAAPVRATTAPAPATASSMPHQTTTESFPIPENSQSSSIFRGEPVEKEDSQRESMQAQDGEIQVLVNGRRMAATAQPITLNGRLMMPLRETFEILSATVQWNAATRDIIAVTHTTAVILQVNSRLARVNGQPFMMEQEPVQVQGRILVPLRFVAEAFGAVINWNADKKLLTITTSEDAPTSAFEKR